MAEGSRARKRQKLSSYAIDNLPDSLLARIFSYLPLKERFQTSAVCRQWRNSVSILWSDIKRLDFADIPSTGFIPLLGRCTALTEIIANNQKLILKEDPSLSSHPILFQLDSFKLYHVCFSIQDERCPSRVARKFKRLLADFSDRLPNLTELVWHDVVSVDAHGNHVMDGDRSMVSEVEAAELPRASRCLPSAFVGCRLRRLQLTHGERMLVDTPKLLVALNQLEGLECLYLGGEGCLRSSATQQLQPRVAQSQRDRLHEALGKMLNLRELCLVDIIYELRDLCFAITDLTALASVICEKLIKLEVLIFTSALDIAPAGLARLITAHPTLKILVVSGQDMNLTEAYVFEPDFTPEVLPRRSIISPIDGTTTLPLLRVFVGGNFLRYVRFTRPQAGAAEFSEIDRPMPEFLAQPEVAPAYEGVWTAKMICESGINGVPPWGTPDACDMFYSTNMLQFHNGP